MKNMIRNSSAALLSTGTLITASLALAQTVRETQTVTTTEGTLSQLNPESIIIRTTDQTTPISYASSKTTTYVDENGSTVAVKEVASGLPVTIYYSKVGDVLVASKVVIRRDRTSPSVVVRSVEAATASGIVTEIGPNTIIIKSETSATPLLYGYTNETIYVDDTGMPISSKMVRVGAAVTLNFVRSGNTFIATKIVANTAIPGVVEAKTVKTTTTTTK